MLSTSSHNIELVLEYGEWRVLRQHWETPLNEKSRLLVAHRGHSVCSSLEQCCNIVVPDIIKVTVNLMERYDV